MFGDIFPTMTVRTGNEKDHVQWLSFPHVIFPRRPLSRTPFSHAARIEGGAMERLTGQCISRHDSST